MSMRDIMNLCEQEALAEIWKTKPFNHDAGMEASLAGRKPEGEVIGSFDGVDVQYDRTGTYHGLNILENGVIVGVVSMSEAYASNVVSIKMIKLSPRLRGRRIMPSALFLLASKGFTILSDVEQTPAAQKMWRYLFDHAPEEGAEVVGYNPFKDPRFVPLKSTTHTRSGKLIYGTRKSTLYRLALVKKGS